MLVVVSDELLNEFLQASKAKANKDGGTCWDAILGVLSL